jgi:hypothetical protein
MKKDMTHIKNWNNCERVNGSWIDHGTGQSVFYNNTSSDGRLVDWAYVLHREFCEDHSEYDVSNTNDGELCWSNNLTIEPGKNILVIGAGPSTSLLKDADIEDVDEIWTCNHFFLHERVSSLNVTMGNLGNEVNFEDPRLLEYMDSNPQFKAGVSNLLKGERLESFLRLKERFPGRVGVFMPRMVTKAGEGPKLLTFATAFAPKEVSFIGIDGHTKDEMDMNISGNVFEPGKPLKKSKKCWHMQRRQYAFLMGYCVTRSPETTWKNLGSRYPKNQIKFLNEQGVFN